MSEPTASCLYACQLRSWIGLVTSGGVEPTARQAYEHGFNVTLALDATTDIREEAHEYSIRKVFPCAGETGSPKEIISLLERNAAL